MYGLKADNFVEVTALPAGMQYAESLVRDGHHVEAEQFYRGLLSLHPEQPGLLHNAAVFLWEKGESLEAATLLSRACTLLPEEHRLHNTLGVVLQSAGRYTEATAAYARALAIQPDDADVHYNLGAVYEDTGQIEQALQSYRKAVELNSSFARAMTRIGAILGRQGHAALGLDELNSAVQASPHHFDAHYYRGITLSSLRRHDEAIAALRRAQSLRPGSFDAIFALGNCLRDAASHEEALTTYWRAMELKPDEAPAHRELNLLAWSIGRHQLYLRSFEYARDKLGLNANLLALEAAFRLRRDDYAPAAELLRKARELAPDRADIAGLLARALAGLGLFEESYPYFVAAIQSEPQVMQHRHQLGFTLLRDKQAGRAMAVFDQALAIEPRNQLLLAGQVLAYREGGDSRYQALVNVPAYVKTYDIKPPRGYTSTEAFNEALAQALDGLHRMRIEPIDQTLRGGTQTTDQLFAEPLPLIQEFVGRIREAVDDYIRGLPWDPNHPTSARRVMGNPDFDFAGSWSCRLASQGYHTNHVHPMGWISSAYYVRIPRGTENLQRCQGWLKFAESNLALGERDRPESFIKPEVGRLVLFPSFFWHGTVPFEDDRSRLTVAFDATPKA
jgi:uncharacterized protein (TIGR02466 family)